MRPLDGIKVVTFEHAIAAPFCTRQLADLGARVIKIERPGTGDFARQYDERVHGLSSHFVWVNRSKESLTLDLKQAEAMQIVHALLAGADVFVQNLAPGASRRLGLDYASLSQRYERLVVCDISGYGLDGPYRNKKAYDLLIQSESGFLNATGTAHEPAKAGCSIADISAGMHAYSSILAALLQRARTGKGTHIDISMFESMVEWMSHPLYYTYGGQAAPQRHGASHATIYPYGPFAAGDGKSLMLGLQNEREWEVFCRMVIQRPELFQDPRFSSNSRRHENRRLLEQIILESFSVLKVEQIVERLDAAGIANAHMRDVSELWNHPQLGARERWTQVSTPVGPIPALLPAGMTAASQPRMDPVPGLGEHTQAILRELGYGDAQIEALQRRRTI